MNRNYTPQPTSIVAESVQRIQESSDEKLLSTMEETARIIRDIVSNLSQGRCNANVPGFGGTSVTEHSLPYLSAYLSLAAKEWVWRMHESNQRMMAYALRD
jgi:hypothetical protein